MSNWAISHPDEQEEQKHFDKVNHPAHYCDGGIEVIDFIKAKNLDFCLGNAVKYLSRCGKKQDFAQIHSKMVSGLSVSPVRRICNRFRLAVFAGTFPVLYKIQNNE